MTGRYKNDVGKDALLDIEDDLILVESGTGVLHMAFAELERHEQAESALAQSLFFAARNVEAACRRIRATLGHPEAAPS